VAQSRKGNLKQYVCCSLTIGVNIYTYTTLSNSRYSNDQNMLESGSILSRCTVLVICTIIYAFLVKRYLHTFSVKNVYSP